VCFFGNDNRHIPSTDLRDYGTRSTELFDLVGVKPYLEPAIQYGDRGGQRPILPDGFFYL
jgi:hypothetical protein